MSAEKLKNLTLNQAISIQSDDKKHKKYWIRGFVAATIYSIIYGFYEYFIVYNNYVRLLEILGVVGNWIIMYVGVLIVVAVSTKFSIEKSIMGLLYMAMLEDVFYWISYWIDRGQYPFPAGNWWDSTFASFRVLGGLGQPLPFFPYCPLYYLPGFSMVILYYISSYLGAKQARIISWIIGPLFISIVVGTLGTELLAISALIIIPIISYCYIILLLYRNQWEFINIP